MRIAFPPLRATISMTTWSSLTCRTRGNRFSRAWLMLTAVTSTHLTRTGNLYKCRRVYEVWQATPQLAIGTNQVARARAKQMASSVVDPLVAPAGQPIRADVRWFSHSEHVAQCRE